MVIRIKSTARQFIISTGCIRDRQVGGSNPLAPDHHFHRRVWFTLSIRASPALWDIEEIWLGQLQRTRNSDRRRAATDNYPAERGCSIEGHHGPSALGRRTLIAA